MGSVTDSGVVTAEFFSWFQGFLFTNECTRDCLKNNIKIYIKMAPTCFGAVSISLERSIYVLANFTLC
jgi:hypothetical protein